MILMHLACRRATGTPARCCNPTWPAAPGHPVPCAWPQGTWTWLGKQLARQAAQQYSVVFYFWSSLL